MKRLSVSAIVLFAILLAMPVLAADRAITNGIDLWRTPGDGTTFADFSKQSIPAGFFCNKSEAFTGKIVFHGVPVATGQPGALGATDTIVQRLDNAVFNKRGVATTRIQVRAMQFASVAPVQTACGLYNAFVKLDGEQPVTTMRIVRDNEKGGRFFAPIFVNIKMTFEPVGRTTTEALELRKSLRFPPAKLAFWSSDRVNAPAANGFVKVDTDGDGAADTYLPGISNFAAGRASSLEKLAQQPIYTDTSTCHVEDEGQHCPVAY
ncbi:MAG TPA: hypothetical protein VGG20_24905 [Thermoanaerobaculia bacterium]|jgi:hypothetical protein